MQHMDHDKQMSTNSGGCGATICVDVLELSGVEDQCVCNSQKTNSTWDRRA